MEERRQQGSRRRRAATRKRPEAPRVCISVVNVSLGMLIVSVTANKASRLAHEFFVLLSDDQGWGTTSGISYVGCIGHE